MLEVAYQELNLMQIMDILRDGGVARVALCQDGRPYVVPMAFQLEVAGTQPVLHLASPAAGRKMTILRGNDRVCLEVERTSCAWIDTVIIEGRAEAGAAVQGGVLWRVVPQRITGRRFFLPA